MTKEVWKQIPGYPDYAVSDHGSLISKKTGRPELIIGSVIKYSGGSVFRKYSLSRGQPVRKKIFFAHTLVLWVFAGIRKGQGEYIAHKNRDTLDNRLENLEIRRTPAYSQELKNIKRACSARGVKFGDFLYAVSEDVDELILAFVHMQRING